jgi:hypothetical protein
MSSHLISPRAISSHPIHPHRIFSHPTAATSTSAARVAQRPSARARPACAASTASRRARPPHPFTRSSCSSPFTAVCAHAEPSPTPHRCGRRVWGGRSSSWSNPSQSGCRSQREPLAHCAAGGWPSAVSRRPYYVKSLLSSFTIVIPTRLVYNGLL